MLRLVDNVDVSGYCWS